MVTDANLLQSKLTSEDQINSPTTDQSDHWKKTESSFLQDPDRDKRVYTKVRNNK